ncbi:TonB-dependent receptor domain-containing protein [Shewanella sp. MBTL60-007]|uniref:TonB-dependent receptor domain-containing protein n=2 Tax=Shewanella sp. MBTL60-007 TaxID=2815911 RepID=UPI001BC5A24F|nr:TonB-dependent receptor [Shewanella sp. MBTL60-007]GIU32497.1 TonB-dependent receptor [Shewanella sp. MBTL60-007]
MMKINSLCHAVKIAIFATTSTTLMASTGVFAAEQEGENIERIEVTGSKIKRIGELSPTPVTVITGAEMMDMGITNVADILNKLPSSTVGISPETSNNYIFANGLNKTDLRGLGSDRTLVLVNGRRFVAGSNGDSAVDLNTIPTAMVSRMEVITGGASAVYGSDAIAGVINIITRTDVEGVEFDASYIQPEQSGGEESQFSITAGGNFLEDKLSTVFNFTYAEQKELRPTDRNFLDNPVGSIYNPDTSKGAPARILYEGRKPLSWLNEAGTFVANDDNRYTFADDGSMRLFDYGEGVILGPGNNGNYCGPSCEGYDPVDYGLIRTPLERMVFTLNTDYDLNDGHKIFTEITYVDYQSNGESTPVFHTSNFIQADNAFLPEETRQLMADTGMSKFNLARLDREFGSRTYNQDRETMRFLVGIEGAISDDWDYAFHAQRGQLEETTLWKGQIWDQRYNDAKDAVFDADGNIVCRDAEARAAGCVPLNLLGENQASQEAINWVGTSAGQTAKTTQTSAGLVVSGALFDVPAGYVSAAFSVDYRKEESETKPDQALVDGTIFGNTVNPMSGEYDVTEFAAEFSIPLLSDTFLVHDLGLDLAYRWMDYNTAGQDDAWKVGLNWAPIEDLRFRATRSKSVRAPNIGELFSPKIQTFESFTDVCDKINVELGPDANRKRNCQATGLPEGWNPTEEWYLSNHPGSNAGNPDLKAETSNDYTVGAVYTPSYLDGFSITVDYWAFEIDDAINYIGVDTAVRYCYDSESLDNIYCDLFTRDATTGDIIDFVQSPVNSASFNVKGLDIEGQYDIPTDSFGDFRIHVIATYLEQWEYNPTGFEEDLQVDVGEYTDPRWKAMFSLGWKYDALSLEARANYRHSAVEDNEWKPENNNYNDIPSHTVWDFTGSYDFTDDFSLRFGVLNAFDLEPPRNPYVYDGDGYYDTTGRAFFLGANYKL